MINIEEQEKVKNFANDCVIEMHEKKLKEADFCIIVYSKSIMFGNTKVRFIYKNVIEFQKKVLNDIKSIDEMMAIDFEMWIFD